jgi:hypothetical protein
MKPIRSTLVRKVILLLVAGILAALLVHRVFQWYAGEPALPGGALAANAAPAAPERRVPPAGRSVASAAPGSNASPLPPPDTAFHEIHAELKERAARGDVPALCRLSFELNRCRRSTHAAALASQLSSAAVRAAAGSADERGMIEESARLAALAENDSRICGQVPPEDPRDAWRYLLAAAQRGHVPSMVRFAIEPPLDEHAFMPDLEGWQAYRAHAEALLRSAASTGDPAAIFFLYWAYAGYPMPGGAQIAPRDPVQALAYALRARHFAAGGSSRSIERSIDRLSGELDAAGIAAAERMSNGIGTASGTTMQRVDFSTRLVGDSAEECG